MKAQQNRNMKYDDMYDYGMFNEVAHPARGNQCNCHYIIINMILTDINCSDAQRA